MNFTALKAALRDPQRWKRWAIEFLFIAIVFGGITTWQNSGLVSGKAPPIAGLRTDGSPVKVSPGETALVVFWATWCGVCKAEAGNIESVAQDWPTISIAMQSGERDEVAAYLKERAVGLPALADDDSAISEAWGVRVVPAHFVVDGTGNIRFRVVGYTTTWGLRARLWWAQHIPA